MLLAVGGAGCSSGSNEGNKPLPAAPVITSFVAMPATVEPGLATTLVAVFANGSGAIAGIGPVTSGVAVGTDPLTATTTFILTVTGAGSAPVTRSATVTVLPSAAPATVTVLRRSPAGDLEPVGGLSVHRSAASTGAFVETRVTDVDGVVDFGEVGASHVTLSVVLPGAGGSRSVVSFVAIPVGAVTLRLDRLPGPRDVLADVHATVTALSSATVLLPGGAFDPAAIPIARQDLQSDGQVTMLASSGGGESGPLRCGVSLDHPLPAAGADVPISVAAASSRLDFTGDVPIKVSVEAHRKDVTFTFDGDAARTSGRVDSCFGLLPDVETYGVTASAWVATVSTYEGYAFATTVKSRRASLTGPTPVTTMAFTMPDLAPDALSYAAGSLHATAVGALAGSVDLAVARVLTPDLAWHLYAPDASALTFPSVPGVSAPAWGDGVEVETELTAVDGVAGFDALWGEARQLGGLDAALRAHPARASAAARMTRFTPLYTIGFDGYTWERYGLVTSDNGIRCGSSCTGSYTAGATATLTATPNPGAVFGGWGGQCAAWGTTSPVHVLVDHAYLCNPSFGPATGATYSLTVAIAGGWPALIQSDDGSIQCGDDTLGNHFNVCSMTGNSGYGLTLTATPATAGTVFDAAWIGDCTGTGWSTFAPLDGSKSCSVQLTPHAP